MKFVVTIEEIVHAEVWTIERKNKNMSLRRFEYEQNPFNGEYFISIICVVQDGTQKAKMFINNEQAVEVLGLKIYDLHMFRAYD